VRLLDLAPTALDLLGVPVPPGFQGRSLAAWIDGEAGGSLPAFGELDRHVRMRSLHLGPNHLIRTDPATGPAGAGADSSSPRFQLYDIAADRLETDDLIDTETGRRLTPELQRRLAEIEAAAVAAGRPFRAGDLSHLNEERRRQLEEQLRSLGYLP
jgi:arylsulfatase A-like enzyme